MYPLKSLFGVWKKTQVRFTSNASAFNLKRKGVLPWTQVRSSLNTSVLSYGRKNVETPNFVYIFEFKLDGTAEEALRQINEKDYAREYEADQRKLYKIGVVFSSETGTIADWLAE